MRTRFKKIWCDFCSFLVYPGQCEHARTEVPAAWTENSLILFQAAAAEARKIGRPLRVTMMSEWTAYPPAKPHPEAGVGYVAVRPVRT